MYIGENVLYLPYLVCYGLMGGEMRSGAIVGSCPVPTTA